MKILAIIFLALFIFMFLSGKIELNGRRNITIWERAAVCVICALVVSIIIGLPTLGIVYLIVH